MPRVARGRIVAGLYHVWRRTNGPQLMFRDDIDRSAFCFRLASAVSKYQWTCIGFVLMPTHFHLVLNVPDDVLSKGMHHLFAPYAQGFNRRWGRSGHLRAEPFKLRDLEDDSAFWRAYRYVARNPVKDGLCEHPADWIWSSYPDSAGYARQFTFIDDRLLLSTLHDNVAKARQILRHIVEPT